MTKLAEYLKQSGMRQRDLATKLKVKQTTVSKLSNGIAMPSLHLAIAIEDATGGAVTARSWVNRQEAAN